MTEDYVTLLAESDKKRGVTYRHTSWTDSGSKLGYHEQARIQLALDWAMDRGHYPKIRCFDGLMGWRWWDPEEHTLRKWGFVWKTILDKIDLQICKFRRWRDRGKNPYGEF